MCYVKPTRASTTNLTSKSILVLCAPNNSTMTEELIKNWLVLFYLKKLTLLPIKISKKPWCWWEEKKRKDHLYAQFGKALAAAAAAVRGRGGNKSGSLASATRSTERVLSLSLSLCMTCPGSLFQLSLSLSSLSLSLSSLLPPAAAREAICPIPFRYAFFLHLSLSPFLSPAFDQSAFQDCIPFLSLLLPSFKR